MTSTKQVDEAAFWLQRTAWLLGAILIVRLVSLWFNNTELFFDEAQYWAWGKEPAFGYFSKPPMLGWIIGATTAICGDSTFCVRLPAPLMHTATAFILFAIARTLFDARTGFWAAVLYALLPAVSLSATLISTDVPLLFFWALALYALIRLEHEPSWGWAVLLGLAIGAGLMAKYAMIYFPLCAAVYALARQPRPHLLAWPKFWAAMAIAFLCLAPNLVWNVQNSFATVSHTGENIGWGEGFPDFGNFGEFLGSQFGVMGPLMFAVYLAALVRLPIEGMNRSQWLLLAFSAPVLLVICFQALMNQAYANWAAAAYVAATVLVADFMANTIPDWWRRATVALHGAVFAVLAVAVCLSQPGQLPLPEGLRPFDRVRGSAEMAEAARPLLALDGETADRVILTDDRRLSALMGYYLRDAGPRFAAWREDEVPDDHFELVRPFQRDPDTPAFFITKDNNPAEIVVAFEDAELLGTLRPSSGETRQVWFYRLRGYSGPRIGR